GLGRPLEAAIAAFNPEMVPELKALDDARVEFTVPEEFERFEWQATLPRDDGAFAALVTALSLTDGGMEPPQGDWLVDRLGPPGAPLAARRSSQQGLILASSRSTLITATSSIRKPNPKPDDAPPTGWLLHLDPAGFRPGGPLNASRLGEGLRA